MPAGGKGEDGCAPRRTTSSAARSGVLPGIKPVRAANGNRVDTRPDAVMKRREDVDAISRRGPACARKKIAHRAVVPSSAARSANARSFNAERRRRGTFNKRNIFDSILPSGLFQGLLVAQPPTNRRDGHLQLVARAAAGKSAPTLGRDVTPRPDPDRVLVVLIDLNRGRREPEASVRALAASATPPPWCFLTRTSCLSTSAGVSGAIGGLLGLGIILPRGYVGTPRSVGMPSALLRRRR
jgi:hypothetical protein